MSKTPFDQQYAKRGCAVCGSTASNPLFRQTFSEMSSGSLLQGYDVVVCRKCGFGFANHIPKQAVFDKYYRDMSKYEYQDQGGKESAYDLARFQAIANIIRRFLPSSQTSILEFGCANGRLLALLKDSGYQNVLGVDPSPTCAKVAHGLYSVEVLTNTLFDAVIADQSVDFIIMIGVLEHVRELSSALRRLRNMLHNGGNVFIAVPDASRYVEGKDAPFQEFSIEHINFFGPVSLTNSMQANGFGLVAYEQGLVEANYNTTTPVIYGVYQKDDRTDFSITPDTQTQLGLSAYVNQSHEANNHILAKIDKIVDKGTPIIVWGAGTHTLRLLATSRLSEAKISAFVDSNPHYQSKYIHGIPIIAPSDLKNMTEPILISSRVYQKEIEQQIRNNLGISNEIIKLYRDID